MTQSEQVLLVFVREPIPGKVKTRLIPDLGVERTTQIYRQLLRQTLETASNLTNCAVELWCDAPEGESLHCSELAKAYEYPLFLQEGSDLGSRMNASLVKALSVYNHVLLIGTDCPEYSQGYIDNALAALKQYDVVLGPAFDGGYVLIGMNAPNPELFQDIAWGTDRVLEMTRSKLRQFDLSWYELPVLRDVDLPEDLEYFKYFFQEALND